MPERYGQRAHQKCLYDGTYVAVMLWLAVVVPVPSEPRSEEGGKVGGWRLRCWEARRER